MELQINLFESASSAGSEKAKKMGLISAGFGRYRSKKGGPITHKVVGGKLSVCKVGAASSKVKPAPKIAASKLYIAEELDFADSDDLAGAEKYVKSFGLKAIDGVEYGPNKNPAASVVGTKPQLVKFLKDYFGGDPDESDVEEVIKPYKEARGTKSPKGKSKPKDADLKKLMSLRKKNYSDSDIEFPAKDALRLKKDLIAYCKAHPDPQWKVDGYDPIPELQATDEDDVYELMASAEEFGLLDDPNHYMWKYVDSQSPDIKKFKKQAGL